MRRRVGRARRSEGAPKDGLGFLAKLAAFAETYKSALVPVLLILAVVLGAYIRLLPAMNYGIELDANDPWVEYWLTKYLVEHGLGSWYTLTADNPATKAFWWPWGRDFYNSEYPGMPWFAAATAALGRSLGFDVKEWTALQPVIFACVAILLVFLLVKRLAGTVAGLVAAYMFAVVPGTSERTIVGFVEKTGVAIPLVYAYLLLFGMACNGQLKEWARYAVSTAAGVMLGLIGFFWGGVHFMIAVTAAYFVIMPIFREPGEREWLQYLLLVTAALLLLSQSPVLGVNYITKGVGTLLPAGYAVLLLREFVLKRVGISRLAYLGLVVVLGVVGYMILKAGVIELSGRMAYALGISTIVDPLVLSVQEHRPPEFSMLMRSYGVLIIMAVPAILYALYKLYVSGSLKPLEVLLMTAFVSALVANVRMAYFTQLASSLAVPMAAYLITPLAKGIREVVPGASRARPKKARPRRRGDPAVALAAFVLLLLVVAGVAWQAKGAYEFASLKVPSIKSAGLPVAVENDAWLRALDFINKTLPRDALVVTWWDYGYWVTVNTGRATMADGATLNHTQIRILARILTGSEDEASELLHSLGAVPNETYVVVYDVFGVIGVENNTAYVTPVLRLAADIPKSYWMLRIGGRDPAAYVDMAMAGQLGGVYVPLWTAPLVYNQTLIYKMMVHGIHNLEELYWPKNVTCVNPDYDYKFVYLHPTRSVPEVNMTRFEPVAVVLDCLQGTTGVFVAVFVYKWLG